MEVYPWKVSRNVRVLVFPRIKRATYAETQDVAKEVWHIAFFEIDVDQTKLFWKK